jgi:hypothetical protein
MAQWEYKTFRADKGVPFTKYQEAVERALEHRGGSDWELAFLDNTEHGTLYILKREKKDPNPQTTAS